MANTAATYGPQRERRSRRRLLTKRKVFFSIVAFMVTLTAALMYTDVRAEARNGGRLQASRVAQDIPTQPSPAAVMESEGTSSDTHADPLLIEHARRSEVLGVSTYSDGEVEVGDLLIEELEPAPHPTPAVERPLATDNRGGRESSRFAIRGGAGGVVLSETDN